MKIITDNAVYVQRKDIIGVVHLPFDWSESLCDKIFTDLFNNDQYTFIKFSDEDAIDFFKDFEYIADYKMKDASDEEINMSIKKAQDERAGLYSIFDSMSKEEKEEKIKNNLDILFQDELLILKIASLNDMLDFKHGRIRFELPEDIEYPDYPVEENKKGIKRLLKGLIIK